MTARAFYRVPDGQSVLPVSKEWLHQTILCEAMMFLYSPGFSGPEKLLQNGTARRYLVQLYTLTINAKLGDFVGSSIKGAPYLTVYGASHWLPDVTSASAEARAFHEIMTRRRPFEGAEGCTVESCSSQGHFPDLWHPSDRVILKCWERQ